MNRAPVLPWVLPILALSLGAVPGVARADGPGHAFVDASTELEVALVTSPLPSRAAAALGARVLAHLDGARPAVGEGTVDFGALAAPPGRAPLTFRTGVPQPIEPAPAPGEQVRLLVARARFRPGAEAAGLRVLELRTRHHDGLVAILNGVEIARSAVPAAADADPRAPALRWHGPERETFRVAVTPGLLRPGADNVLELAVRPAATRRAPRLEVALVGHDHARIVRGPLVGRVSSTGATIVLETDLSVEDAEVRYGLAAGPLDRRVASSRPGTRHELVLTGLSPGSTVRYEASIPGDRAAPASFPTAPPPGAPVRFVVYGDSRSGHAAHGAVLRAALAEQPAFLVSTGDLVLRGTDDADWQRFFEVTAAALARVPFYTARGNHDVGEAGAPARRLEDLLLLPPPPPGRPVGALWYSFRSGDVHVAVLDAARHADPLQRDWLDADLAAARAAGARALFVVTHDAFWSRGYHGGDAAAVALLAPVLERHRVSLLFSGHDHLYQRGRVGLVRYVLTGGGGAPLYPPRCGGRGQRRCAVADGAEAVRSEHHYVRIDVEGERLRLCARRPDGSPLEPCLDLPLDPSRAR